MKTINIFIITLFASVLLLGCEKIVKPGHNGIFIDGSKDSDLMSAFAGGTVIIPSAGSSYRCRIFEKHYLVFPIRDRVEEKVYISGFLHAETEYKDEGGFINNILIHDVPGIGDLSIALEQGKYMGDNDLVASVTINEYFRGAFDMDGNQIESARFSISIVLTDNRKIDIRFTGATPKDDIT